ncbi:hypothetical protein caldi_17300 [Caldinitratiruptor microaerophilus]|uniref:Uncharacterized protein n=1 Tax=Caldinitratiruptor microaerophilus TaxID=671077 RepID=A0AA35CNN3_9FIRM|nr:hypothetical protein caldi_17300 [Caldinitratiruptor microaerophilus]
MAATRRSYDAAVRIPWQAQVGRPWGVATAGSLRSVMEAIVRFVRGGPWACGRRQEHRTLAELAALRRRLDAACSAVTEAGHLRADLGHLMEEVHRLRATCEGLERLIIGLAGDRPVYVDKVAIGRLEYVVGAVYVSEVSGSLNLGYSYAVRVGGDAAAGAGRRPPGPAGRSPAAGSADPRRPHPAPPPRTPSGGKGVGR